MEYNTKNPLKSCIRKVDQHRQENCWIKVIEGKSTSIESTYQENIIIY